ncbi:MAG: DUF3570 domain-containing protein [Casimicrobium sp.]
MVATSRAPAYRPKRATTTEPRKRVGAITLAALALPGVTLNVAHADSAPEDGVVSAKLQVYKDSQPNLDRIKVIAPSLHIVAPIAGVWSVEASVVQDNISGASPRWHTSVTGASHMEDRRVASDVKLTRFFERAAVGVRFSYSDEHDYRSNALALDGRYSSADNNTTWMAGIGASHDLINPVNQVVENERKNVVEGMIGVTQALSKNDLAQFNLTHVRGRGYFNDPYKLVDQRPRDKNQTIGLLRWNHFVEGNGTTVRSSYRFYSDSFGVQAHTVQLEWVVPLSDRFMLTPSTRYYTQRQARFYFNPVYDPEIGEPYPAGYSTNPPTYYSADARLSSYGAFTLGGKFEWRIDKLWSVDLKYELYQQRSSWRLGGGGSPGLLPFRAQFAQIGISRRF